MLSTGSVTARSTCLRCQLRQIIFGTHGRRSIPRLSGYEAPRNFSSYTRHLEELGEAQTSSREKEEDGKPKLSKNPLGRIVGKPGRRQRERTARLKMDAMKKPFEVIVMDDVAEKKEKEPKAQQETTTSPREGNETSAREIASEILSPGGKATQEEVEQSINSLNPQTPSLDQHQFDALASRLQNSYNSKQLSSYLRNTLKLSSDDSADEVHLTPQKSAKNKDAPQASQWRAGKTPIDQRHEASPMVRKSETGKHKLKLARQIMRLAWNVTVFVDEQSIGELELPLKSWQLRYLFDLSSAGMPTYQAIIDTPILRRTSEVRPYRPHNIMRITARRRDAEEIAAQIGRKLEIVEKLETDLSVFKPLLGQPGWPERLDLLFTQSALEDAGQRTKTIVELEDGKTIGIYGDSSSDIQRARQVLLSLLDISSASITEMFDEKLKRSGKKDARQSERQLTVPEVLGNEAHLRYRDRELGRLSLPAKPAGHDAENISTAPDGLSNVTFGSRARDLAKRLVTTKPLFPFSDGIDSRHLRPPGSWGFQFCKILQPASAESDTVSLEQSHGKKVKGNSGKKRNSSGENSQHHLSVMQTEMPGVTDLLSFCSPKSVPRDVGEPESEPGSSFKAKSPQLVAHFFPSPFTKRGVDAMRTLPRICLYYSTADGIERPHAGILSTQEIRIPLPDGEVDLCALRRPDLGWEWQKDVVNTQAVQRFTDQLKESVESGTGHLGAEPQMPLKLPGWMVGRKPERNVEVQYLFERFEQVQDVDFLLPRGPELEDADLDPVLMEVLRDMPEACFLRYKEIDGGSVGGRRSELTLRYDDRLDSRTVERGQSGDGERKELVRRGEDEASRPEEVVKETEEEFYLQYAKSSLGLARVLSRINSGAIESPLSRR